MNESDRLSRTAEQATNRGRGAMRRSSRRPPVTGATYALAFLAIFNPIASRGGSGATAQIQSDPLGDAVARPMDPGVLLPFDSDAHALIDLLQISVAPWTAYDPAFDLFAGEVDSEGAFLRLELLLEGLVNPPGASDPYAFQPFRYGNHPVYGFVEIDMDDDVATGGELIAPQFRYLGNVSRFGGQVSRAEFHDRVALDASAFDDDFETPPFVERRGEEFHLALLGDEFGPGDVQIVAGNSDLVFDAGEAWRLRGTFFHRAHGFEPFSFVEGGHYPGEYMPVCDLQFRHDLAENVTHVTLVFPLTNEGAGLMRGEPAQPNNEDPTDQASVMEAMEDLQTSAIFLPLLGTGIPEEAIIRDWAQHIPAQHLDPGGWTMTALLGSSYTAPSLDDVYFLWSDVYPNVDLGDTNGSGAYDGQDRQMTADYIASHDANDGVRDGVVRIGNFAADFSVFDVNYDGLVDGLDLSPDIPNGDGDHDGDLDLLDFALLQRCFGGSAVPSTGCQRMDLVRDFIINLADAAVFDERFEGPRSP